MFFSGDFFQIPPVTEESKALYMGDCLQWGALNSAIFLETNHRFKEDPEYGEMLERVAKGKATIDDFQKINSRVISDRANSIKIVNDPSYTCAKTVRGILYLQIYFYSM